ncbi:MAG: PEP/pyruvate-binding domain-containing protein [Dehalococcoidia bacterium]
MSDFIAWFDELTKQDVPLAGGKGANLGEMRHAGLPVPPGFVVTAMAYRTFLDEAGLRQELDRWLNALNIDDRAALEQAADRIQMRIRDAPVPSTVHRAITEAYRELCRRQDGGELLVAVRSSATMEDTEQASFAGMNQSFLNVRGDEELIDRVKDVWASLFSPRVVFYRKRLNLPGEPEIAVIIQAMVNATKSGVAFSIEPATGAKDTIVIEAAPGLGEVVVQGAVEPDHYAVAKADLAIKDVHVGHKQFMLTRDASGRTVEVQLPPERADARVLSDGEIRAVAELVCRDEAHYGVPQDIE